MATTSRNYAPRKIWIDPLEEAVRESEARGFNRGVVFTVAILASTFVLMDGVAWATRWLMQAIS